ncbi:MAG: MurT ligase domain-containing protein [Thermoleophilia bacterium]
MRLALETAIARAVGRLSRAAGRGGGTTLPGKLLVRMDPGALAALSRRLPDGAALVSATNGKTTTTAMAAEILAPTRQLAWNRSGANLVSGIASTLLDARGARLGLLEVDEAALPVVAREVRPGAIVLGNLFRDQLDRYGELETVAARWRDAVDGLPPGAVLVANADDPIIAELARDRAGTVFFGLDDPSVGVERLSHAADSKYCRACGAPYRYAPAYVGHLGAWRCPTCSSARPPLAVTARAVALRGLDGVGFDLHTPVGLARIDLPLPGLYNVYNALAAASLSLALGATLAEVEAGLARFRPAFGRFERIAAGRGRSALVLLIKNPAGANEAIRTIVEGGAPRVAVVALNDEIADGRDVSWIWDVDFEPLMPALETLVATGSRAEELALRFAYGGFERGRIEVIGDLAQALDRGLELARPGEELAVLPTYTAMLALRAIATGRGWVQPFWA